MVIANKAKIVDKINRVKLQIHNWYNSKETKLNIISPPYNFCNIFLELILNVSKQNKKILYLSSNNGCNKMINDIKKYSNFRNYTFIKSEKSSFNSNLIISNENFIDYINCEFDLIIFDNINGMISLDYNKTKKIFYKFSNDDTKIIYYSIEALFSKGTNLYIPVRNIGKPISEPTLLLTKIDINKDIPYLIYEYLKWSLSEEKKIIIYVPDKERVYNVYNYLLILKKNLDADIEFCINENIDKKKLINFCKKKRNILVTDYMGEENLNFCNVNIMVYFADDYKFDYKKLVYITARTGNTIDFKKGDVIFLAKKETDEIAKARKITREFNKEAWEMGLLSI